MRISASDAALELLEVLVQPLVGLDRARFHPRLKHHVADLLGGELRPRRDRRLAVVLLERVRLRPTLRVVEVERPCDALGRLDLEVLAEEGDLALRAGCAMNDPPGPARPEVDVAAPDLELPGTPPA